MTKKKSNKRAPRSGIAVAAMSRKAGLAPMKDRREPRRGAKNKQAEILKEYKKPTCKKQWNHCGNGRECLLGHKSQGNSGCDCSCPICCGIENNIECNCEDCMTDVKIAQFKVVQNEIKEEINKIDNEDLEQEEFEL